MVNETNLLLSQIKSNILLEHRTPSAFQNNVISVDQ